jgi:hypothetical protein
MRPDRSGYRARTATALCAAAAMTLAGTALAQDRGEDGLVLVSRRPELKWLDFYFLDVAIELEWRRNVSQVDPQIGSTVTDTQDRFREILQLGTRGYIGHPNLLELDLRGSLLFTQRLLDLESSGASESLNEFLFEYDFSGLFFPQQKFPVTIYTRRTQSDIDRVFGSSLEQVWTETGAWLIVRDPTFPTNVHLFTRNLEQTDVGFNQDFTLDQNTFDANGRVELGANQSLWWDFSYDDIEQSGRLYLSRNFERLEGNITHTLDFGTELLNQLRTVFHYFDETGTLGFRQIIVNPRLRLQPTTPLQVWFDYRFEDLNRQSLELTRQNGSANLRHQLFDSLTTTARVGGIHQDIRSDSFRSDEIEASLQLDYTKEVPLGTLYAVGTLNWNRIWQTERGTTIPVLGQPFTFPPSDLIIIFQENVEPASIVVRDQTGTIVYTLGVDYLQLVLPTRVEIRRIAGGGIAPGETVLIDYAIGPEPAGKITTGDAGIDVRYTFLDGPTQGLSVYGRYLRQDQERSPEAFAAGLLDNDYTDYFFGAEYTVWKLYFKAEHQIRDSEVSPFNATWLEARYVEPLGRGSSLVLSLDYAQIDRRDVDIRTATTTFSGTWNQQFTDNLWASLILLYQNVEGNTSFDSQAFEQKLDITWRVRQTQVFAQIRNRWRDNSGADDTFFQTIFVGLRREF